MKEYNIIKTKIESDNYDFDDNLLLQLSPMEFTEINNMLVIQVNKGNSECYKYIKYLKGLNLVYLMSTKHVKMLTEENWIILATNVYLVAPKPSLLEYLVQLAKTNSVALEQLKIIAQERPDIVGLWNTIEKIENQVPKKENQKADKLSFEYYKLDFGVIVKIQPEKYLLYRLDYKTHTWIEDHELFTEMSQGSYHYKPIKIDDIYPYSNDLDQSKGVKL